MLHKAVFCAETSEQVILPPNANTAAMRSQFTYISVNGDDMELVKPCGGHERQVPAYWRGLPGGETRARELMRQARANAMHRAAPD